MHDGTSRPAANPDRNPAASASAGTPVRAALILIGNEILSGRTQDTNLNYIAKRLGEHGIRLAESRVIPDVPSLIQETVNALRSKYDYVFTTGGIGPTHDDITAENVAVAFGVELITHPEARAILESYYRERDIELNEARLRMARTPAGATLVQNPVSGAPGFRIGNVYVMAGVPKIMQAMLENIVGELRKGEIVLSRSLTCNLPEGVLAAPLGALQEQFSSLDVGCYPGKFQSASRVTVVLRGVDAGQVSAAEQALIELVEEHGGQLTDNPQDGSG